MRVVKHVVHLVETPEIGPDTLIALEFTGRHLALLHQGLDHYLKRTDADPRQWIDPERMAVELAYLMVKESLKGARSHHHCRVMLPLRTLAAVNVAVNGFADQVSGCQNPDLDAAVEQTRECLINALSMASH